MAKVSVCIPTLTAYKELDNCIETIYASTKKVDDIYIIDNGRKLSKKYGDNVHITRVTSNLGVAKSWNWFINNVPEIRIICNDDVQFYPEAIQTMLESYDENRLVYPNALNNMNSFSCFILPDKIVKDVGLFDETISPNYAYFEDNDYHRRMLLAGYDIKPCDASVGHVGSSTLKHFNKFMEEKHHPKFRLARSNYNRKWGGEPGKETFATPYNK